MSLDHSAPSSELLSYSLLLRYNRLLEVIAQTLQDLLKALKGLVVMSSQLELMANSLYNNIVPELWNAKVLLHQPVQLALPFCGLHGAWAMQFRSTGSSGFEVACMGLPSW